MAKPCIKKPLKSDIKIRLEIDWFSQGNRNKPDVDNIIKPISDALRDVVYVDDCQVCDASARKHDVDSILHFNDESIQIVEPLLHGSKEYVYVRLYRVY